VEVTFPTAVHAIAFSLNPGIAYIGTATGKVISYDFSSCRILNNICEVTGIPNVIEPSATGENLLIQSSSGLKLCKPGNGLAFKDLGKGKPHGPITEYCDACFAVDGKTVISVDTTGALLQWDVQTGAIAFERRLDTTVFPLGHICAYGNAVFGFVDEATITKSDIRSGTALASLAIAPELASTCVRILVSPNERLIVLGCTTGAISVWEVASGQKILVKNIPNYSGNVMSFSPNGHTLGIATDDFRIHVVNLRTEGPSHSSGIRGEAEVTQLWNKLTGMNAIQAHVAMCALSDYGNGILGFVKANMRQARKPNKDLLSEWITMLSSNSFSQREEATLRLVEAGEGIHTQLRKRLAQTRDVEESWRLKYILSQGLPGSAKHIKDVRVLTLLEDIGTADAFKVVQYLASGDAEAHLTKEARIALARAARQQILLPDK
jgi:hypothetical protein